MKKIENILRWHGWKFHLLLILLFFLWAAQLFNPIISGIAKEITEQSNKDWQTIQRESAECRMYASKKLDKARKMRGKYGPREYFEDLKDIEKKFPDEEIYPAFQVNQLWGLSWQNVSKGNFSQNEVEAAVQDFHNWEIDNKSHRKEAIKEFKLLSYSQILSWAITFYFRALPLILFAYLIRMASRKGILETILADKKRFFEAIFFWPILLFKYPNNVVREIRVEAELRRIKGLFRRLTSAEVKTVRRVANSSEYNSWLFGFRVRHELKRGLFVAILATILIHLFSPSICRAVEKKEICISETKIVKHQQIEQEDNQDYELPAILEPGGYYPPPISVRILNFVEEIWISKEPDTIDRIPRISLFGQIKRFINQIGKGIINEYDQKNNIYNCFIGFR